LLLCAFGIYVLAQADSHAAVSQTQAMWKAGLARVVITPEHSMWMAGYAARTKPSEGKVHDLYAKALALEACPEPGRGNAQARPEQSRRGTRLVIVTADLIGFPREFRDQMEKDVSQRFGLRPQGLLLNASHTHSGPELRTWRATQTFDLPDEQIELSKQYTETLAGKLVELVGRAIEDLTPAQLSYMHARAGFAMNRRLETERGYTIAPNADGPVDHDVPVLRVDGPDGKLRALLFGYACHNTTLDFYQFCGDYAGFAQQYLEEAHPGVAAMFMIGCGGDQNPVPRRTLEWAQQHGRELANGVEAALLTRPRPVRGPLRLALEEVTLELTEPPSRKQLSQQAQSTDKYARWHAEDMLRELKEKGRICTTYPYLVQVAQFGDDLTMIGLAGEVVVDYSLRLKADSRPCLRRGSLPPRKRGVTPAQAGVTGPAVWVAGYCNDVFGYVPSERVLREGGYEARGAILYYGTIATPFAPSVENLIVGKVHELVERGNKPSSSPEGLVARTYNSGFAQAHDCYNSMGTGSDGKIYYALSSESFEVGAQMFCYDPATDKIEHLGDITEACGEKDSRTIAQGKVHVNFVERDGKLYFATHVGYYSIIDGMEKIGIPPQGYKPYPGGHFLAFDMVARKFQDLAKAPHGEGILSMTMDTRRGRLYGLTWPTGYFIRYDLADKELKNLGPISRQGENGKGENYRTLCRSLVVDPGDGSCYFTTGDGDILRYRYDRNCIEAVAGDDMRKDYFGLYDPTSPGHMGYNWRQTLWCEPEKVVYGVHGNSGYLFRFNPLSSQVEVLDRITSLPSKRSGMFDQFSYGYLGFALGPDGRTIHYLTGGPVYVEGRRVTGKTKTAMGESKGLENLHLVTYDIKTAKYTDHGPIFFENGQRPVYVNSIAVGKDGTVYALSRITEARPEPGRGNSHTRADLISMKINRHKGTE